MPATKIESNQSKRTAPKLPPLYVPAELHSLIVELMRPRLEMMLKIVSTRMVSGTQNADEDDADSGEDWWPDYSVYSHLHYMTEMNGLLHLTQTTLKGMVKELESIGVKLQDFVEACLKERKSGELVFRASSKDEHQNFSQYLMIQSLIKDMAVFVKCCSRHTIKQLSQRIEYSERAAETKSNEDRIRLKIFDERSFTQLHSRMDNLKNFVQEFCNLFSLASQSSMPENGNDVADKNLAKQISS